MSNSNWRLALPMLALASIGLVGCGGGGGDTASTPAAPAAAPAAAVDPSQTGSVSGTVTLTDGADPDSAIKMDADPVCAGLHSGTTMSETRVTDDAGNLANVLVRVTGVSGNFSSSEVATLTQQGCIYTPRVQGVLVGQTLKVVNQDPTLHNVHATPAKNPEFNQAQPFQGMELERTFAIAEVIPVKCDVHPWMQSYIHVVDNPFYAITGADGSFSISGIPAGSYTVEAWHELLGTQSGQVTIEAGGSATLDLGYGG